MLVADASAVARILAALTQLVDQGAAFPAEQQTLLTRAITRLNYDRVSSNGIFYLQATYWRARRGGLMNEAAAAGATAVDAP